MSDQIEERKQQLGKNPPGDDDGEYELQFTSRITVKNLNEKLVRQITAFEKDIQDFNAEHKKEVKIVNTDLETTNTFLSSVEDSKTLLQNAPENEEVPLAREQEMIKAEQLKNLYECLNDHSERKLFKKKDSEVYKLLVCHSWINYNLPTNYAETYPLVPEEKVPAHVRIVVFTPFGCSKNFQMANDQAHKIARTDDQVYQYAEFNPGDSYPEILMSFVQKQTKKRTIVREILDGGKNELCNYFSTVTAGEEVKVAKLKSERYFNLARVVDQVNSAEATRQSQPGAKARTVVICLLGCMGFQDLSAHKRSDENSAAEIFEFLKNNKEEFLQLGSDFQSERYSVSSKQSGQSKASAKYVRDRQKPVSIDKLLFQIQFKDSSIHMQASYQQLKDAVNSLVFGSEEKNPNNFKEKMAGILKEVEDKLEDIEELRKKHEQGSSEADALKKMIREYEGERMIQFDGSEEIFRFLTKMETWIPTNAFRTHLNQWLQKHQLDLNEQTKGRLFAYREDQGYMPHPNLLVLLHKPLPESFNQKWNSGLGEYENFRHIFLTRFYSFTLPIEDPFPEETWNEASFEVDGVLGQYIGFLKDKEPCGWGRWQSSERVIFAYWDSSIEDSRTKINGTVLDVSSTGFYFGTYEKGQRHDFALWREMVDGSPRQYEGYFDRGVRSGSRQEYEVLPNGESGEWFGEKFFVKGKEVAG